MIKNTTADAGQDEAVAKLNKLIKGIEFAMMTTTDADGTLHSRPMATQLSESDGVLWFFTRASSHKVDEIKADMHVNLAYADPSSNRYVSVAGTAQLVRDKVRAKEFWTPMYKAWFPKGLEDPDLALLRVTPHSAEYWDAPSSTMAHLVGLVKTQILGQSPNVGDHGQINLRGA